MTQIFVDHNTLINLTADITSDFEESDDHRSFLDLIRRQVYSLDNNHSRVVVMYYFENLELERIAVETGLDHRDIRKLLRESLMILKYALAEAVQKRWPGRFKKLNPCPICNHPARTEIEKIISARKPGESWGTINKKIKRQIDSTFNPPIIMINHTKYHKQGVDNDRRYSSSADTCLPAGPGEN
ncbi:MAG: hypothetical protein GY839_17925 [candidate division Zixibacteria bacterium]|nr:hypothetical protein [candidate division Zixibacteria bacterium]